MLQKLIITLLSIILFAISADAKQNKGSNRKVKMASVAALPTQASLIVDVTNGKVLHRDKATEKLYPASTVKMMTMLLALDALNAGKISMDTMMPVSKYAQSMRPCKLWLKAGEKISFRDAIQGIQVKSANDASVVVAEYLAGSEEKFAKIMNKKAKELGMDKTHFVNASGWHHPDQHSTAEDLAKLGVALKMRHHAKYAALLKKTSFEFRGQTIKGHDRVLSNYPGVETSKTGFHNPGGFNLVTVVKRNGQHLVGVVTGGTSAHSRNTKMVALLDKHLGVPPTKIVKNKPVLIASNKKFKQRKYRRA